MRRAFVYLTIVIACFSGHALAHSLGDPKGADLTPPMKAYFESLKGLSSDLGSSAIQVRGVIEQFQTWPVDRPVKACFFNGSRDLRQFFITTASQWLQNTSLVVDFGSSPAFRTCAHGEDIRIKFSNGGDSWSYVGTDSRTHGIGEESLDINSVVVPLENSARNHVVHTILHEFGHALGLEHEHQSPEAHCDDELNWNAIYKAYVTTDRSKQDVRDNIAALVASDRLRTTPFDPKSVMMYEFAPWMLRKGTASRCYAAENDVLSDTDKGFIQTVYPVAVASDEELMQSVADDASGKLANLDLSPNQQSIVAAEIGKTLKSRNHKIALLQFNLSVQTRGIETGEVHPVDVSDCNARHMAQSGVGCKVAKDGSEFSISVQP